MQDDRNQFFQPGENERSTYANGHKTKTINTRVGKITFSIPSPLALQNGLRSERVLTIVLAEMYVWAVSTRKVSAMTRQLCGVDLSAMQANNATAQLNKILQERREAPPGEVVYLYLAAGYEKANPGLFDSPCPKLVQKPALPSRLRHG